ncbi:MAG: hypothetical protein LBH24_06865 [Clostridiales bacterium]|jgi:hypothetical protein|nr:hypothetical protein [Clostridiales bacterium]
MEENMLRQYRKKLIIEAGIKACILGLAGGLLVGGIIALVSYLTHFIYGFIVAFSALAVVAAGTAPLLYKRFFRVNTQEVAARVDRIGLEERVITAAEFAGSERFIIRKLKADTAEKLQTVTPKAMKFKFPKKLFFLLGAVFAASAVALAFATVQGAQAIHWKRYGLDTPAGFRYETNTAVTWTPVEGAGAGYHIRIEDEQGAAITEADVSTEKADVSALEPGAYSIVAYAKNSGNRIQSETSRPFRFRIKTDEQKERDEIIEKLLEELRTAIRRSDAEDPLKARLYAAVDALDEATDEEDTALDLAAKVGAAAEALRVILNGAEVTVIVFDPNNGRNESVSLRRKPPERNLNGTLQEIADAALKGLGYPRADETFKLSDIPGAPNTVPAKKAFMGWAVRDGENETVLKNREITEAVENGETAFIAVWLSEDEIIQRLLDELRKLIGEAKVFEDQRAALQLVVDALEQQLQALEKLSDKIEAIRTAKLAVLGMIESFRVTVSFDPANGLDDPFTVHKLPLEFTEKDGVPKKPKNAPEEGMAFAGWAAEGGEPGEDGEPEALDAAGVAQAILDGAREFTAVWYWPDTTDPLDPEEPDPEEPDPDDPIEDIFDDTLEGLENLDQEPSETEGGGTPPPDNEYRGDEVIDGKTPYTDVEGWKEAMEKLLREGDLSPELREIIERYFDTLK